MREIDVSSAEQVLAVAEEQVGLYLADAYYFYPKELKRLERNLAAPKSSAGATFQPSPEA